MHRSIFSKLVKLHIITPGGLYHLVKSFAHDGISLMAMMQFAAHYYPNRCAIVSDGKRLTYQEMYEYACYLAKALYSDFGLKAGMSVGLLCRSHLMGALLLLALSRLGVRIKLINTDMAPDKMAGLVKKHNIKLLIYDADLKDKHIAADMPCSLKETAELLAALSKPDNSYQMVPHIRRGGDISVFTGGTSGKYKEAPRRMSIYQFLPPFFALLKSLRIDEYDSVFLPLPMYHGFGLATLIISFLMGKKICLMSHFDADQALKTISEEKVEVLPVVPAMLARLWQTPSAPSLMRTVRCVICGGDHLDRKWIQKTNEHLGNVIYNLFGTSEAGFFMIASPEDLLRNEEVTIGKPIPGVKCKIKDADKDGTGSLWVRSSWAMISMKNKWQDTGDLVYRNPDGFYFYRGRTDIMVVCGGENVFPEEVERIINRHPEVVASVVYSAADLQFGTVLNARVELIPHSSIGPDELKLWLSSRLSRAEMPHLISFQPIIVSETGKKVRDKGSRQQKN